MMLAKSAAEKAEDLRSKRTEEARNERMEDDEWETEQNCRTVGFLNEGKEGKKRIEGKGLIGEGGGGTGNGRGNRGVRLCKLQLVRVYSIVKANSALPFFFSVPSLFALYLYFLSV